MKIEKIEKCSVKHRQKNTGQNQKIWKGEDYGGGGAGARYLHSRKD